MTGGLFELLHEQLHHDCRGGQGENPADDYCTLGLDPREPGRGTKQYSCYQHLQAAHSKYHATHGNHFRQRKFKPDGEHQEYQAEFSKVLRLR